VFGQNILSRQVKLDWSRRFHTNTVHGQGKSLGDVMHRQTGTAIDDSVAAHRTLLLVGGEQQPGVNASNRAQWEKKARLGESIQYTATVQGWRDAAGDLWRPNTMVAVWDPYMRWDGTLLLVKSVTFSLSVSGATTAALTLCPRQAYEAPDETSSRRGRGGIRRLVPFFAWPYNSGSLSVRLAPAAQGWLGPSREGDLE
jgi:prophage tail gpP-like protein